MWHNRANAERLMMAYVEQGGTLVLDASANLAEPYRLDGSSLVRHGDPERAGAEQRHRSRRSCVCSGRRSSSRPSRRPRGSPRRANLGTARATAPYREAHLSRCSPHSGASPFWRNVNGAKDASFGSHTTSRGMRSSAATQARLPSSRRPSAKLPAKQPSSLRSPASHPAVAKAAATAAALYSTCSAMAGHSERRVHASHPSATPKTIVGAKSHRFA